MALCGKAKELEQGRWEHRRWEHGAGRALFLGLCALVGASAAALLMPDGRRESAAERAAGPIEVFVGAEAGLPEARRHERLDGEAQERLRFAVRRGFGERARALNELRALACEARVGPLPGVFEGRERAEIARDFERALARFDRLSGERAYDGDLLFDGSRAFFLAEPGQRVILPVLNGETLGIAELSLASDESAEAALAHLDRATQRLADLMRALPSSLGR